MAAALLLLAALTAGEATERAAARLDALDRQIRATRRAIAVARAPADAAAASAAALDRQPRLPELLDRGAADRRRHARAIVAAETAAAAAETAPLAQWLRILTDRRGAVVAELRTDAARQGPAEASIRARLAQAADPLLRPGTAPVPPHGAAYRLPLAGQVVLALGDASDGVRARGLTLATRAGAIVRAPARGRVAYAGRFRGYGGIVILDHGHGWTTLLTGLDRVGTQSGRLVPAGAAVGRMGPGAPRLGIELRHRGRPVDAAALAAGA